MEVQPVINIENIGFSYPGGMPLFENFDFKFMPGIFYLIKGPSGSGKSTLLRLLNNLESPDRGQRFFRGRAFSSISPTVLRRSILYIQQTPVICEGNVRDNLLLPFTFHGNKDLKPPGDHFLIEQLKEFSLGDIGLDRNGRKLSLGQQQRVCLIRGLMLSPDVVLLDEPTSALDEESCRIVESHAEALCFKGGKTVIMVSHREFDLENIEPFIIRVSGSGRIMSA